jgi:hypothetical protein
MIDPFEQLIEHLGIALGIKLHVDANRACLLNIHNRLSVQIQIDAAQEKLIIASFLFQLPPGRFRQNILAEALKTNHLPDPRVGILGFLASNSTLTMHQRYPITILNGEKLAALTASFIEYAQSWQDALSMGHTSPAPVAPTPKSRPFGIK